MKFIGSRNIAIAVCAIIFCLGIVTFSYAQNVSRATIQPEGAAEKTPYVAASVNGKISGEKIFLQWDKVEHPKFSGYKIVISKNNPNPKYPEDGYLYYITDQDTTSAVVDNTVAYQNGDFGEKLIPGERYYFSITVLYTDKAVPGDTVQLIYPATATAALSQTESQILQETPEKETKPSTSASLEKPQVRSYMEGNRIIIKWNRIVNDGLKGYKVVISQSDKNPAYPKSGYLTYITNKNTTEWVIDNSSKYNGGDFGGYLTPGENYYVSITALYNDSKVAGNAVMVQYPSDGYDPRGSNSDDGQSLEPVVISATPSGSNLILTWPMSNASNFEGYKVVISKNNPNPKYPDDGYLEWITDRHKTSVTVNADTYYGGDIQSKLVPGESYYFSISIIYDGWVIVPGPAQYSKVPE